MTNEAVAFSPLKLGGGEVFRSVADPDLRQLYDGMRQTLISELPELEHVATYYLEAEGKRMRPGLVLVLSRVLAAHLSEHPEERVEPLQHEVEFRSEREEELNRRLSGDSQYDWTTGAAIFPRQRRLAEIVEMVHTSSLLHDDVIDHAELRRGRASANVRFSGKLAVLGGDFLLARSSLSLSELEDHRVTRLLSSVIAELVEGEFWQLRPLSKPVPAAVARAKSSPCYYTVILREAKLGRLEELFGNYLRKTYLKTASLIAKSCAATAILAGAGPNLVRTCEIIGECIGMAFQIADDILDFDSSAALAGKETGVDLKLGVATAPVLFSLSQNPELLAYIDRQFSNHDDPARAATLITRDALESSRLLADLFVLAATSLIETLHSSPARDALYDAAICSVGRKK